MLLLSTRGFAMVYCMICNITSFRHSSIFRVCVILCHRVASVWLIAVMMSGLFMNCNFDYIAG